jgi:tetratricopeptide (TPR) repeat protein
MTRFFSSWPLSYILTLTLLMTGHAAVNSAPTNNNLDLDLKNFRLESIENTLAAMPASPEKDYFAGVLANRCGRMEESVRLLEKTLPKLRSSRPDRAAIALETLADNYLKLYRYSDAARSYDDLLVHFADEIDKGKLESIKDDYGVIKLLTRYPPQTIAMSAPIRLQTRRSPIGTIDTDLTVNNVETPWILDTGASFSVVSASFAKRLGIQPSVEEAHTKGTVNGVSNLLHVGILPELDLGGATIRNVVLLILEDKSLLLNLGPDKSYQINAILGFPVFQILGSATFKKDGGFEAGSHTAPSASPARVFMNQLKPLVECSVRDRQVLFAFDTGADISTFSTRYFQEFQDQFKGLKKVSSSYGGAGGVSTTDVFVVPEVGLRIAKAEVNLKQVTVYPSPVGTDLDDVYGNLGRDVVAGFSSFTLDFRHMTFSLESKSSE